MDEHSQSGNLLGEATPHLEWRGVFENEELNRLHAECFEHPVLEDDWWHQVNKHSLGWVCLRYAGDLTGFANVAWDGGVHAFLLDVLVTKSLRHRGLGTLIVNEAIRKSQSSGCEWLHVDFEPQLRDFYWRVGGFCPSDAGLISLR